MKKLSRAQVHMAARHMKNVMGLPASKTLLKLMLRPMLNLSTLMPLDKTNITLTTQSNGEWVTPASHGPVTIFYIHGGAFIMCKPKQYRSLTFPLARATGCRVFATSYRLSPEHRFPHALDDCVASYEALLKSGVKASDVVFAGDSAGGNLVCATLLHLIKSDRVPLPAAAVAISPWLDLDGLLCASRHYNRDRDLLLPAANIPITVSWYCDPAQRNDPLASPLYATAHTLARFPPMHFEVCGTEMLLDDSRIMQKKLQEASGSVEKHSVHVYGDEPHVFQAFGDSYDLAGESFQRISKFISNLPRK